MFGNSIMCLVWRSDMFHPRKWPAVAWLVSAGLYGSMTCTSCLKLHYCIIFSHYVEESCRLCAARFLVGLFGG